MAQSKESIKIVPQLDTVIVPLSLVISGNGYPSDPSQSLICFLEQMPEFPVHKRHNNLGTFIEKNLQYPKEAIERKEEGRVVIKFLVLNDGTIAEPVITKSVSPALDSEAIRLVLSMPKWKPGLKNGRPVSVFFTIPITFKLDLETKGKFH